MDGFYYNTAPKITPVEPTIEGDNVKFETRVEDADTDDTHTFDWSFGDKTSRQTDNEKTEHEYKKGGEYIISVTVHDGIDSDTEELKIQIVFPGDADNDGLVDAIDILPIGLYWEREINKRKNASSAWGPQLVAAEFSPNDPYWQDPKNAKRAYANTNGDRVINSDDVNVIVENWGKTTLKMTQAPSKPTRAKNPSQTLAIYEQMLAYLEQMPASEGIIALRAFLSGKISHIHRHYVPAVTNLLSNYPNPFNPETWIPYQLAEGADVTIRIYAASGRLVRTLALGQKPTGYYLTKDRAAHWNGKNTSGETAASGVYFVTLEAGEFYAIRKMVILK